MSASLWLLLLLLLAAAGSDLRSRRIPNALALAGALAGIALGCAPGGVGLLASLAGMGIGLVALLPMYLLRALGAGDVKLMAAVGAIVGASAMPAVLAATFVAGGLMSIVVAASRRRLLRLFANLRDMLQGAFWCLACGEAPRLDAARDSAGRMPYALAIAAGAGIAQLWWAA
ncbi:A24 family peptidase [Noviherbaspirillum pedocola]|uniref:Prepilin peptidase n=1 Tax=Noviherbaspirillum pedocola TaxID=2801341 RepID=A0A934W5W8_9BURK|nr:A24 family peptidase [Noviherbaspirillum pedocola]MBK4733663.1 prepilin peptidase [Noviherbaspirillum pedocola]